MDGNSSTCVELGTYGSHRRLDFVDSRSDAAHIGEGHDQANGSVSAHAQIADIIEEDNYGDRDRIGGFAQQRPNHHACPARLIDNRRPKQVKLDPKAFQALAETTPSEISPSRSP